MSWRRSPVAWMAVAAATLVLASTPPAAAKDPRPGIVALALAGDSSGALNELHSALRADPTGARRLGLLYLRGHLLERLGKTREAADAFAASVATEPSLAPWARLRLARVQDRLGHPEVAAGLAAALLAGATPAPLVEPAANLLVATLERGGDCRLLQGLPLRRLPSHERRLLELAAAECRSRSADAAGAAARYRALLEETTEDDVALHAAEGLAATAAEDQGEETELLLGLVFYRHREFDRALPHLERALASGGGDADELRHAIGRSHFWQSRYGAAANAFAELAQRTVDPLRRQDALHQQGRSAELLGDWPQAGQLFRRAAATAPAGELAPLALFSALRLDWRAGREPEALQIYDQLRRDRRYRVTAGRAALFLAASDLVRGRADRAGPWIEAARATGASEHEVAYWQGRRSELQRDAGGAARAYLAARLPDASHPLAVEAAARLATPTLAPAARALGLQLSSVANVPSQFGAWLLLGETVEGQRARRDLLHLLAADRRTAPYVRVTAAAPAEWPIFAMVTQLPEAQMISLGLASEGAGAMLRYFPPDRPSLLLAGARLLLAAGEPRRAIYAAEVLRQRVPNRLPGRALAEDFRRALFPLPHAQAIHREAARQAIDPHLLAAILREESRFDADAVSPASARGLAQFTLPTARRIAAELGRAPLSPRQLADPEVSVALAARYLANLARDFAASPPRIVAAYNAGEPQARLWRSYCFSDDPAEYYTKVSFKETRAYVARVLSSREEYAALARR